MQNTSLKVWKPETPVLHVNSAAYTRIAFLNYWVFNVILSSTQLSQDFKVTNGGPLSRKIPIKINRCLFEIKASNFVQLLLITIGLKSKEKYKFFFGHE